MHARERGATGTIDARIDGADREAKDDTWGDRDKNESSLMGLEERSEQRSFSIIGVCYRRPLARIAGICIGSVIKQGADWKTAGAVFTSGQRSFASSRSAALLVTRGHLDVILRSQRRGE